MKNHPNKGSFTFGYKSIDKKQALTKFSNLIRLYPYHPIKSNIENIGWLTPQKLFRISDIPNKPFCGIIEILHRKGFPLVDDWLYRIENLRHNKKTIIQLRNTLLNHLAKLLKNIRCKEENNRIIVNNQFKELSLWIRTIYDKINYLNEKGDWSSEFTQQLIRRKEIGDSYKEYRRIKAQRMEKNIDKYHKKLKEAEKDEQIDNLILIKYSYYERKRKLPKNPSEQEKIRWKLERMEYNSDIVKSLYEQQLRLELLFTKVFHFRHNLNEQHILTTEEFDSLINEIFLLMGYDWVSCINGELMLIGYSKEDREEREVFKYLQIYPKVIENLENAKQHLLEADWNSVSLYCSKAIEHLYKNLLKNMNIPKQLSLSDLTQEIRKNMDFLFKKSDSAVMDGISHLILSGINVVGTIRNTRDSGHGNDRDVLEWEARMSYSYTILLLRTLELIRN
ncbi:MAG: hypothetical protein ACFFG0_24115 [Candidatus Thorarchaeota archaeon]